MPATLRLRYHSHPNVCLLSGSKYLHMWSTSCFAHLLQAVNAWHSAFHSDCSDLTSSLQQFFDAAVNRQPLRYVWRRHNFLAWPNYDLTGPTMSNLRDTQWCWRLLTVFWSLVSTNAHLVLVSPLSSCLVSPLRHSSRMCVFSTLHRQTNGC